MDSIANNKFHFAPLVRQEREIKRLLRARKFRNVSHFMRCAIDHYLDRIGRPPLSEQARQMAEDYAMVAASRELDGSRVQDSSRASDEEW